MRKEIIIRKSVRANSCLGTVWRFICLCGLAIISFTCAGVGIGALVEFNIFSIPISLMSFVFAYFSGRFIFRSIRGTVLAKISDKGMSLLSNGIDKTIPWSRINDVGVESHTSRGITTHQIAVAFVDEYGYPKSQLFSTTFTNLKDEDVIEITSKYERLGDKMREDQLAKLKSSASINPHAKSFSFSGKKSLDFNELMDAHDLSTIHTHVNRKVYGDVKDTTSIVHDIVQNVRGFKQFVDPEWLSDGAKVDFPFYMLLFAGTWIWQGTAVGIIMNL